VKTGTVDGKTARRHTSAEFLDFITRLLKKARWAEEQANLDEKDGAQASPMSISCALPVRKAVRNAARAEGSCISRNLI
jgi:hypothetical protein